MQIDRLDDAAQQGAAPDRRRWYRERRLVSADRWVRKGVGSLFMHFVPLIHRFRPSMTRPSDRVS